MPFIGSSADRCPLLARPSLPRRGRSGDLFIVSLVQRLIGRTRLQDACEHSLLDSTAGHPHSLRKRWLRPLGLIGLALCLRCRNGEAPHCPLVHRFLGKMSWPHPFVSKMRLLRSMSSYLKRNRTQSQGAPRRKTVLLPISIHFRNSKNAPTGVLMI